MKGSLDLIIGLVLITIISIFFILGSFFLGTVADVFESNNDTSNFTVVAVASMRNVQATFNTGFLVIFIGMLIGIFVLCYFSDQHPMFFPLSALLVILAIFLSFHLANTYWAVINASADFLAIAEENWMITFIMRGLPFWTTIYGFIILYFTYASKRGEPQY